MIRGKTRGEKNGLFRDFTIEKGGGTLESATRGADDRSRLRLHVRAAQKWLGRAEDSLSRSDDIRGDLSVMLAQAELTKAQEAKRPGAFVRFATGVAPLLAAAAVAGVLWGLREEAPPPTPPAMESLTEAVKMPPPALPETEGRSEASAKVLAPAPEQPAEDGTAEVYPAEEARGQEKVYEEAPAENLRPPGQPSEARIPSEEMQRLMSSAGQSLRAIR